MCPPSHPILDRPRLNQLLDQMLRTPLTVIRAPMGFGKTTAVRAYLDCHNLSNIYLPLLGAGSSPSYFWERLSRRVEKKAPQLGSQLLRLGFPENGGQAAKIVELLLEASIPEPFFLMIDDYHLLECEPVVDLLCLLVSEHIPNLHIVLLTREIHLLPETDLQQKGLCFSVTQKDLRFQPAEILSYYHMLHLSLSEEEAREIAQWTGGWISGIYLLSRGGKWAMREHHSASIDELLENNLYHSYSPEIRQFLGKLAFLDAFTPEMVAEVFGDPAAPDTIRTLLLGNAFLTYNNDAKGYQMTDLLRDFLQKKARQAGYDPRELYHRTAEWFLRREKLSLAFIYFQRAKDTDRILELLNQEETRSITSSHFDYIQQVFQDVPASAYLQYPLAALQYIRAQALTRDRSESQILDKQLQQMERHFLSAGMDEALRSRVLGEIHNTWILVVFNDVEKMADHAAKAVHYFDGRTSCLISSETEFTFGSPCLLYMYYNRPGHLDATVRFISENFHILGQAVKGCGSGSESLILAEYALETGDFDAVTMHALKAIYQARMYHQVDIELCATFALCRLALYRGNPTEAEAQMSQLAALVDLENSRVLNTTVAMCSAYLSCCLGRPEGVPGWLRENAKAHGSFLYRSIGFHQVIAGFTALLEKKYLYLDVYCDAFEQSWGIYGNQLGLIMGGILRAGARSALYGSESGALTLLSALDIAVQDGIILPFAENAQAVLPLLSHPMIRQRYPAAYLNKLVDCCRNYQAALRRSNPTEIQLTEREQEIIQLLSKGKLHDEISKQLYISVPTVRYHVKNIYQKLGVNNKLAAVERARALRLLP